MAWTHPTTNTDGTPLADLAWTRFFATRDTIGLTDTLWGSWFPRRQYEGRPDSMRFTTPPSPWRWKVGLVEADTIFNQSPPSNIVTVP